MARRKKSSPLEDVLDLLAMLPWWVCMVLAAVSYFLLHRLAAPIQASDIQGQGGAMVGAMIQNALDMAKRYATPAGRGVLRERKAAFAITLAPGLAEGANGDLVAELLALRDQLSALQVPILIHAPADGDRIVTQSEAGLVVHVSQILTRLGMNPGSLASGVKVQVVASPTSTVSYNKAGLHVDTVVEKILWLLEGIGLRVSTEDTGKEVQSLIAALKAA